MGIWDTVSGSISTGTGTSLWTFFALIVAIGLGFVILGIAGWWWFFKKRWNLKAEIKLTRSGGRLTTAEWGKAMYNAKRGVVFVKRPGMRQKAIPIPLFDIRKYLQGDNIVTFFNSI